MRLLPCGSPGNTGAELVIPGEHLPHTLYLLPLKVILSDVGNFFKNRFNKKFKYAKIKPENAPQALTPTPFLLVPPKNIPPPRGPPPMGGPMGGGPWGRAQGGKKVFFFLRSKEGVLVRACGAFSGLIFAFLNFLLNQFLKK